MYSSDDLGSNPEWCQATGETYPGSLQVVVVQRGEEIVAAIPMLLKRTALDCQIGELNVFRFRPRVLSLAGARPGLPDEPGIYDAWFECLLRDQASFDAILFTLPSDSFAQRYLQARLAQNCRLKNCFIGPLARHHLIQMPNSMAEYMSKFTSKTRKNRYREVRQLERRGRLELVRISDACQIELFLCAAGTISRRTYQHRMLKAGLQQPALLRRRLEIAAKRGWLRSYLLRCGGDYSSYLLGYQYGRRYEYTQVGFDPAWSAFSVGTVLQLLVLEDLFADRPPEVFDFGAQGPQKEYFGNDSYYECRLYLLRRTAYARTVATALSGCTRMTAGAGGVLQKLGLKSRVRRWIRYAAGC